MNTPDQLDQFARGAAVAVSVTPAAALVASTAVVLLWAAWRRTAAPALVRYGLLELARMWAGAVAGVLAFGIGVLSFGATLVDNPPARITFLQAYSTAPSILPGWFVFIAVTAALVCAVMIWHLLNSTTRQRPDADAAV
ncbi:hypothetical protein [Curtobacterium sp. MCBD17_026]|uniref:hypothetical protein n=1 Tax=Curtobacterium sp. MCBD17_026 TaxID=2175621 RepID=UPI0011B45BD2|nr:hypothetical protein [Curtobacterium sp. MCBD17_026]WIB72604.1 hypothetical protein DEI85_17300 [Curtobacterium sp. MCBD17_026]